MNLRSLFMGLLISGCGIPSKNTVSTPTPAAQKRANSAVVSIESMLFSSEKGQFYVNSHGEIFANGLFKSLELEKMNKIATLTTKGEIILDDETIISTISKEGQLSVVKDSPLNATISKEGLLSYQNKEIWINSHGQIEGIKPNDVSFFTVGLNQNQHKMALFVFISLLVHLNEIDSIDEDAETITKSNNAVVLGSLAKTQIDYVIKKNIEPIRQCYIDGLKKNPSIQGSLQIQFIIANDGSVSKAKVKRSELKDPYIGNCIVNQFKQFTFPKPHGGGIVIITYPFAFGY